MRKITKQDLISFIFNQPAEKEVKMGENYFSDKCGCIGVQYVREKLFQVAKIALGCGMNVVENSKGETLMTLEGESFFDFVPSGNLSSVRTYGEIQEFLKTQGWAKSFIPKKNLTN